MAPDEGETESYRAITKQLQAVGGEGAGPPAVASGGGRGDPPAAASAPGRLSGTFSRRLSSLGVFGWGAAREAGPASSDAGAALALQRQVR